MKGFSPTNTLLVPVLLQSSVAGKQPAAEALVRKQVFHKKWKREVFSLIYELTSEMRNCCFALMNQNLLLILRTFVVLRQVKDCGWGMLL